MQRTQVERLKHYIVFGPVNLTEVTECLQLTMARAQEIHEHFNRLGDAIPEQMKGELNLLKDLADQALEYGEQILDNAKASCGAQRVPSVTLH